MIYEHKGEDKIKSLKTFKQCSLCEKYHRVGEEVDVYDCCDYEDKDWMVNWAKRLQKKMKEPYLSDFVKWVKVTAILLIIFSNGCEDLLTIDDNKSDVFLELTTDLPFDAEGVYSFDLPSETTHTYLRIDVRTNPLNRVGFFSPNTFSVIHQGRTIITPIINYSVYAKSDSTSRQFAYVYRNHIGETFKIYAQAVDGNGNSITDSLYIKIY
jgi:hypothetical protein